ncbi:hypothetical protein ABTX62_37485 [Streptomyces sp. NPDC096046]|uniref:hypothetical protein n=1 Tax=Streptomyces sp. NPDC096046 TaxID=3155542 RepID=UPI0033228754
MDTEEPDEMDRVGGLLRLVQDAVGPHLPGQQSDLVEGGPQGTVAELRRCRMPIGVGGDDQMRVGGLGPAASAFAQPVGHEADAQVVEVDGVGVLTAVDRQRLPGQVCIGQVEAGDLDGTHGVDRDQADNESRCGAVQPVQGPGQAVAGQRQRQVDSGGRLNPDGGIAEDQLLLLQGAENATQYAEQSASHVAPVPGEFGPDVVGGDLPQILPGSGPGGQGGPSDAQIVPDAPVAGRGMLESAAAPHDAYPGP